MPWPPCWMPTWRCPAAALANPWLLSLSQGSNISFLRRLGKSESALLSTEVWLPPPLRPLLGNQVNGLIIRPSVGSPVGLSSNGVMYYILFPPLFIAVMGVLAFPSHFLAIYRPPSRRVLLASVSPPIGLSGKLWLTPTALTFPFVMPRGPTSSPAFLPCRWRSSRTIAAGPSNQECG